VFRSTHSSSTENSNSSAPSIITSLARPKDFFTSFLIGILSCDCGSLVGMGGGFILIPLMTTLFGLLQHAADDTSLLAVATIGLAGAGGYQRQEGLSSGSLCGCSGNGDMVTVHAGSQATTRLSPVALRLALGVSMLAVVPFVPAKTISDFQKRRKQQHDGNSLQNLPALNNMSSLQGSVHVFGF
jgi:uncharacterized membrane protein YfcA